MKNKPNLVIYIVLALLFGAVGVHKFYEGKTGAGFMYLLFFWTGVPAILLWIDILRAITSRRNEFE